MNLSNETISTCVCQCSNVLKDYNIMEFFQAHPIQTFFFSLFLTFMLFFAYGMMQMWKGGKNK